MLEMDYLAERATLEGDIKVNAANKDGNESDSKLLELQRKFMPRFIDIESARMHAWASAGQQSLPRGLVGK